MILFCLIMMLNIRNAKFLMGKVFGVDALKPVVVPDNVVDDFDGVGKVFLGVMDGFGYNRLPAYVKGHDGFLSELVGKGVLKPFTSQFPAKTSTSLTSIITGFTPTEHGVVGYQMFSREYGCVFSTLDMKPVYGYSSEVEIAEDYARRLKPWMPVLEERRVGTLVVTKGSIVGSGLSRVIHAGQGTVPYSLESEMFVKCKRVLEKPDPVFLVLFYSEIDTLEHRFGPYSEEVTAEIESFEFLLKNFFGKLSHITKRETMIRLTADHGVCETRRTRYVKDFPEVAGNLRLPPVGDSRTAFLFGGAK
ncbi:alkaline phosphatase family protein [Candidatus Bathyarchaeota archaeon]|nr:alkaline phosphatase family protein [Candidatus Bathyarchaeota archaeon]